MLVFKSHLLFDIEQTNFFYFVTVQHQGLNVIFPVVLGSLERPKAENVLQILGPEKFSISSSCVLVGLS